MSDLLADSKQWAYAGVSFGEYDTMLLQKSLRNLLARTGASQMRFWGKVLGNEFDYFVAEGKLEATEAEQEENKDGEPRGTGVNEFVYWITNSPLEDWY